MWRNLKRENYIVIYKEIKPFKAFVKELKINNKFSKKIFILSSKDQKQRKMTDIDRKYANFLYLASYLL